MSWELVEHLRRRYPEIEPFPRETAGPEPASQEEQAAAPGASGAARGEGTTPAGEAPPAPAPGQPAPTRLPPKPRREEKGPTYLTPGAWVPRDRLLEICRVLKEEPQFAMDYCSWVSGVDWPARGEIQVTYHLFSMTRRHEILLKVRVPRDDARVPTVTPLWAGTNWHEREAYDLLGIIFEGHPDLRRIMMTEDWAGYPLRKDYVYEDPSWLVDVARRRQQEIQGLGLGERA